MENYNTKDDEAEPSTSKKESQRDNSVDDMYVDSQDDDMANSECSVQASATYSVISKLDMAGTGPNLPKLPIPKTDMKSHQKRKRHKTKRITGRIEKKKRPLTKRQQARKAPKHKPKTKEEKKEEISLCLQYLQDCPPVLKHWAVNIVGIVAVEEGRQ